MAPIRTMERRRGPGRPRKEEEAVLVDTITLRSNAVATEPQPEISWTRKRRSVDYSTASDSAISSGETSHQDTPRQSPTPPPKRKYRKHKHKKQKSPREPRTVYKLAKHNLPQNPEGYAKLLTDNKALMSKEAPEPQPLSPDDALQDLIYLRAQCQKKHHADNIKISDNNKVKESPVRVMGSMEGQGFGDPHSELWRPVRGISGLSGEKDDFAHHRSLFGVQMEIF